MCPNGLPALDDHELATRVALLPLEASEHQKAILLTVGLVPGRFGLLARPDRDWLMKTALKMGALPKMPVRKKTDHSLAPDHYCDQVSKETQRILEEVVAVQVPALGGRMPVAPARRNW